MPTIPCSTPQISHTDVVFVISQLLKQGINIPEHSHFIIKILKLILKVIIITIIKPRRVNFEKWRHLDSSSLTAAGGAIPQKKEEIPSYSWDSDDD